MAEYEVKANEIQRKYDTREITFREYSDSLEKLATEILNVDKIKSEV